MKRWIPFLICCTLILSLYGCDRSVSSQSHVRFYYRSEDPVGTLITCEERTDLPKNAELTDLLQIYLQGPQNTSLVTPFKRNTTLVSVTQEGAKLYVTLSREHARLSGQDLIIACGCFATTCFALTDAASVTIRTEGLLMDGQESITIDRDSLLLDDEHIQIKS